MCKYVSDCNLCKQIVEVNIEQKNMQDVEINISSPCPNLSHINNNPINIDVIHELMADKDQSALYKLICQKTDGHKCTAYYSVIDALGKNLGRYYEIS